MDDCDDEGPLDDEGMLTEAADYICANGPNGTTTAVITDYASYVAMVGVSEAVCFGDYLVVAEIIQEIDLDISAVDLILEKDCLRSLGGCRGSWM